jgi:ketosteroid isomerase-like protein
VTDLGLRPFLSPILGCHFSCALKLDGAGLAKQKEWTMKTTNQWKGLLLVTTMACLALAGAVVQSSESKGTATADSEKAVLKTLERIQNAAEELNADKVFSYVLENDHGALIQNGRMFASRAEALESTRQGLSGLQKVQYRFDQQSISLLSPTVALAVSQGTTSVTTSDGRSFSRPFVQSVVLVLTNGDWKVFHSHRSSPADQ